MATPIKASRLNPTKRDFFNLNDSRPSLAGGHFFTPPIFSLSLLVPLVLLCLYLLLHLFSLSFFPFVHSDEVWLASLSRSIYSGGFGATEDFFVLTLRHPHGLKILYHLIQGPFILLSWSAQTARLPSLVAALVSVCFFWKILFTLTKDKGLSLLITSAFALDVQFFYISHLGRQEALILMAILLAVYSLIRGGRFSPALAAAITGISIFIHPNAFIAAAALLPWVLWTSSKGRKIASAAIFVLILFLFAAAAIAVSLALDPDFFTNYRSFGDSVGVTSGVYERFMRFREFFHKMMLRHAGTYYLPPAAHHLLAIPLIVAASLFAKRGSEAKICVGSIAMTAVAIFIIGKNSPPSFVFFTPWAYIGIGLLVSLWKTEHWRTSKGVLLFLLLLLPLGNGVLLGSELYRWYPDAEGKEVAPSYGEYVARIEAALSKANLSENSQHSQNREGRVLANLNTGFAFPPDRLRVWRDLAALPPADGRPQLQNLATQPETLDEEWLLESPLFQFLLEENIRWIIWPREEMEMIYSQRPVWNALYGNPYRFYPELIGVIHRYGELIDRFDAPFYAIRLVPFMDRYQGEVEVYQLSIPIH